MLKIRWPCDCLIFIVEIPIPGKDCIYSELGPRIQDDLVHLCICITKPQRVNSSLPGQNGCHFADHIFRCIFMNKKFCILIKISFKFVPKGPIDINVALVQIMA